MLSVLRYRIAYAGMRLSRAPDRRVALAVVSCQARGGLAVNWPGLHRHGARSASARVDRSRRYARAIYGSMG